MKTLKSLTDNLILPESLVQQAMGIYDDVSTKLQTELQHFNPDIYPQGSFRLGTAIRPISGKDEHDLDFVSLLHGNVFEGNPQHLKSVVGDALNRHFGKRLEEKDRCWRLCFDNFHVDILPAIPENNRNVIYDQVEDTRLLEGPIRIPQKDMAMYKSSNPRGFATWFELQASQERSGKRVFLKDSTEPLANPYTNLGVLQQSVMLMKRHRDFMFLNDNDNKPISVIVSTLAAYSYDGETDVLQALSNMIQRMPDRINSNNIRNPANPRENFADKWADNPIKKRAFNQWLEKISTMVQDLSQIINDPTVGRIETNKVISDHFGDDFVKSIVLKEETRVSTARNSGTLKVSTAGVVGAASGTSVKANTFYGD